MKASEDPAWLAVGSGGIRKLTEEQKPKEEIKKETKTILRKANQWQQPQTQKKIASN